MKNLILAGILAGFVGGVAADETQDYINANMLWSDNEEFQTVNVTVEEVREEYVNDDFSGYGHEEDAE